MPGAKTPYPPKFRAKIIALVRAGRTQLELTRENEPTIRPSGTGLHRRIATEASAPMG